MELDTLIWSSQSAWSAFARISSPSLMGGVLVRKSRRRFVPRYAFIWNFHDE